MFSFCECFVEDVATAEEDCRVHRYAAEWNNETRDSSSKSTTARSANPTAGATGAETASHYQWKVHDRRFCIRYLPAAGKSSSTAEERGKASDAASSHRALPSFG